ncbi:MAG TPA: sulfotransferase [Acetobacteraceae bacterium]|nr:sulfotransferase [Acetobacteraceae bacterium]
MASRPALPDVVIGGAPRSGTTFVAELLGKHPGVYLARPIIPEPKICLRVLQPGDAGDAAAYARVFCDAPEGSVRAEKTSNYFENAEARERLARVLPATKFVFMLREPVARAYSNWKWSTMNGLETLPFADAVALEGRRPNPLGPERAAARPFDYMLRGHYGSFAAAWYETFGRDRIRFFVFEDAMRDLASFVFDLQTWMGLDPLPWPRLQTGRVNPSNDDAADLDPMLAARLRAEITPEVGAFAALTGLDVSAWPIH